MINQINNGKKNFSSFFILKDLFIFYIRGSFYSQRSMKPSSRRFFAE